MLGLLSRIAKLQNRRKEFWHSFICVRSQAKDSRRAMVEQSEFDEELSEQEGRLLL
jgi:hypothetical protein